MGLRFTAKTGGYVKPFLRHDIEKEWYSIKDQQRVTSYVHIPLNIIFDFS